MRDSCREEEYWHMCHLHKVWVWQTVEGKMILQGKVEPLETVILQDSRNDESMHQLVQTDPCHCNNSLQYREDILTEM